MALVESNVSRGIRRDVTNTTTTSLRGNRLPNVNLDPAFNQTGRPSVATKGQLVYSTGATAGFAANTLYFADGTAWQQVAGGSAPFLIPDGTAVLPGLAFQSDPDTGIFRNAAGDLAISDDGVEVASFGQTAGNVNLTIGTSAATGESSLFIDNDQAGAAFVEFLSAGSEVWILGRASGSDQFFMSGAGTFSDAVVQIDHAASASQGVFQTQALGVGLNVQSLSGPGAITANVGLTLLTTTGIADALTLADGTAIGQLKTIVHVVDGGSAVLTPTTLLGGTTITFTNVGESATLAWTALGWAVVAIQGAVLA